MWAMVLGFAVFAVVICIDTGHWDWLCAFAGVAAVWSVAGWYWLNREVFARDCRLLINCSSPMKCEWVGTFVFFVIVILLIIVIIIWLLYLAALWIWVETTPVLLA